MTSCRSSASSPLWAVQCSTGSRSSGCRPGGVRGSGRRCERCRGRGRGGGRASLRLPQVDAEPAADGGEHVVVAGNLFLGPLLPGGPVLVVEVGIGLDASLLVVDVGDDVVAVVADGL